MIFGGIPKKVSATDCPVTISQKAAIEAGGSRIAPSLMPRDSRDAVMLHVLAISFCRQTVLALLDVHHIGDI